MSVEGSSFSKAVESQWSNLPRNVLTLIANHLNNDLNQGSSDSCGNVSIHNLRLRSVCKTWRLSIPTRNKKFINTTLPFPILSNPKSCQGHFILSQSTIYLLQRRQQHQTCATNSKENYWLLRVEEETSTNSCRSSVGEKWRPLNPLTRTLTTEVDEKKRLLLPKDFPKSINVLDFSVYEIGRAYSLDIVGRTPQKDNNIDEVGFVRIDKVAVSSCPFIIENNVDVVSGADYLVVMAICNLKLGLLKLGDEKWIPIDDPKDHAFLDVVFYKRKFYAVDYKGKVFMIGPDLKAKEIAPGVGYLCDGGNIKNMVTSGGELFMIDTFFGSEQFGGYDPFFDDYLVQKPDRVRLNVYKLNEEKKEWERVCDLNNSVFFVGYDCSYSVSTFDFAGLKPNCVYYYVDDSLRDCNEENKLGEFFTGIGVYDMSAGSCGPLSNFPDHWPIFMPPSTFCSDAVVESQWSHLPSDILTLLANRLNNNLGQGSSDNCGALSIHNLRLRSVCKTWRSSIPSRNKNLTPTILPFPIFPNSEINSNPCISHFTLSQSTIYLLQQQQHQTCVTNSLHNYWLLRVEKETLTNSSGGEKWRPLNPLTRTLTTDSDEHTRLLLPKGFPKSINLLDFNIFEIGRAYNLDIVGQTSKKDNDDEGFVRIDKVVVSSSPFIIENNADTISEADYLVVMAICNLKLWFLKLGDEKWTPIDDPMDHGFLDVVFHRGKFYAIDYKGKVFLIGSDLKAKEIASEVGYLREGGEYKNLVTSGGDLFMIDTFFESEPFLADDFCMDDYHVQQPDPVRLKVYKLNEEKKEWERVFDLNNHVFFVGYDCSYSVSARDFDGLKPNCIYYYVDEFFRDCFEENKLGEFFTGIGVFDMDVGSCGPLSNFPNHWPVFMPSQALRKLKKDSNSKKQREI